MTNFKGNKEDFMYAWRRLHLKWEDTIAMYWDDSKSDEFRRVFWNPFESEVVRTHREMDRLSKVITIIERKEKN